MSEHPAAAHAPSTFARASALVAGVVLVGFLGWALGTGQEASAVILAAALLPVGLLLVLGALTPGRDSALVLQAAEIALRGKSAEGSAPGAGPAEAEPESSSRAEPTGMSPRAAAELIVSTLAFLAVLGAVLSPFVFYGLFTSGLPERPAMWLSLASPFAVRPLFSLRRRLSPRASAAD